MSGLVVRTNIFAVNAHRNLKNTGIGQSRAAQRLASGFRINSAADDAAGLAISETMRAQIRGLDNVTLTHTFTVTVDPANGNGGDGNGQQPAPPTAGRGLWFQIGANAMQGTTLYIQAMDTYAIGFGICKAISSTSSKIPARTSPR